MRRLGVVSIALVAGLVAGWLLLRLLAPSAVAARLGRTTGLAVRVAQVRFDPSAWRLVLRDVVARTADGREVLRAGTLLLPPSALGRRVLEDVTARRVSLLGLPAWSGRARRLRLGAADGAVVFDGLIEHDDAVLEIAGGRLDPASGTLRAARLRIGGGVVDELPSRWPLIADRVVVTGTRVAGVLVERLVADGVGPDAAPARLRARVRLADGRLRARWTAAGPRLGLRLREIPVRALAGVLFRDARLSGGITSGTIRLGHVPGRLEARLRIGPTRLERAGETWLGWSGLTARIGRFDLRSARLVRSHVAVTKPVVMVRRDRRGIWPAAGWNDWLAPGAALRIGAAWAWLTNRFGAPEEGDARPPGSSLAVADGTVTAVDAEIDPPARLEVHDLDLRVAFDPAAGVEGRLDGRVGAGGRVAGALTLAPAPGATLSIRGLPVAMLGGWSDTGRALLGLPLGRMLALAGADPTLDVTLDVPGDASEKRFGLASALVEALVDTLRDRVTTPLLAAADVHTEDGVESLALPVVAVDADAPALAGDAAAAADRTAVLLAQFPELSVRLDGRFAADEPAAKGAARAAAMERHLTALGFGDRVVVGPVGAGTPGVVLVVGGRVS